MSQTTRALVLIFALLSAIPARAEPQRRTRTSARRSRPRCRPPASNRSKASAICSCCASSMKPNEAPCYRRRMSITLYDMPESPHARKVRLLAAELGIPLDCVRRDPRIGETRSPDYLAKNPNGKVPTLVEDDFVLWELPAILKYLAAKHPERKLAGADAKAGSSDRSVVVLVGLRSGGRHRRPRLGAAHQAESAQSAWQRSGDHRRRAYAHQSLPAGLDEQLGGREFIVGPLSIADFAIGPRFDRAPELLNSTSRLTRISAPG